MQQVFSVMNKLLNTDPKTKNRRLLVRTYKVVPLSQRTGVLEWCENTQTFGDYLASPEKGAHQKYRPNDYPPQECRRKMIVRIARLRFIWRWKFLIFNNIITAVKRLRRQRQKIQ